MKVVEIFKSIDGEGIRAGFPVTFIRLAGCNLRCEYCDTTYSYDVSKAKEMTISEILASVSSLNCKRITLTGGEPLIHDSVEGLINILVRRGYEVNIETNGSVDIQPYVNASGNPIITMDYKCPCSGMEDKMLKSNLLMLRKTDVLKFVVGSVKDLLRCHEIICCNDIKAQIFISPVFGKIEPKEIVDYVIGHNMNDCRVQLQLHKIIWDPELRGV